MTKEIPQNLSRKGVAFLPISIVIPTYRRDSVLIETLTRLLSLDPGPAEILVIDQIDKHQDIAEKNLESWQEDGQIKWLRLAGPSITRAINVGLCQAKQDLVLCLDDDIVPDPNLLKGHLRALEKTGAALVAGRVIQPWQEGVDYSDDGSFHFACRQARWVNEFMGGNFSVRREIALKLGGFDERFVRVCYHFEAEFAYRLVCAGHRIFYEPAACVHHLRARAGGTRVFGDHLRSYNPNHSVGAYYCALRTRLGWQKVIYFFGRPLKAIATRHHLRNPWWIPATLVAEFTGMAWALVLAIQGPRYLSSPDWLKDRKSDG
jgi:GT2 family glycosyltransferase